MKRGLSGHSDGTANFIHFSQLVCHKTALIYCIASPVVRNEGDNNPYSQPYNTKCSRLCSSIDQMCFTYSAVSILYIVDVKCLLLLAPGFVLLCAISVMFQRQYKGVVVCFGELIPTVNIISMSFLCAAAPLVSICEDNYPNAVYKLILCGQGLGAMTLSTG